jgi:hypothetical protein
VQISILGYRSLLKVFGEVITFNLGKIVYYFKVIT